MDGDELKSVPKSVEQKAEEKKKAVPLVKSQELIVHPIVLLSVVDHYTRAAQGTSRRVVGCLLGEQHGSKVDIQNTFAVPFEEHKNVWYLDHAYLEKMFKMFRKIHARENVVGWYSTASNIQKNDTEIHEIFRKFCSNPIFLVVDVQSDPKANTKVPVQAYYSVEQLANEEESRRTFVHVNYTIGASEAEEVAVDHLLRNVEKNDVTTLSSAIEDEVEALEKAAHHMQEIANYLNGVASGDYKPNYQLLSQLQILLNSLPSNLIAKEQGIMDIIRQQTSDSLLATYVAFATRLVMAIHTLIKNKISMRAKPQDQQPLTAA